MEEGEFAGRILAALGVREPELESAARATTRATTFRGEIERERTRDLGDPRTAGWTFLVNKNDPRKQEIVRILKPLAEHRGMANPERPLLFHGESSEEWFDWMLENYSPLETDSVPHYVLVAGGPDQVPFLFQSLLDSAASVGRVDFESLDELRTYVDKVLRIERAASPALRKEAVFFAPDPGPPDATYFSRSYMADPLSEHVRSAHGFKTEVYFGGEATKAALLAALRKSKAALVYTASHGIAAAGEPLEIQKQYNGAICCQHTAGEEMSKWLLAARDIEHADPFLEGAVFFQFACFGYGTPAESDYAHWLGSAELNSDADFVAALPKKLLAHPRGPVAFIGHLDAAWLHGFTDPDAPYILERWHPRIAPYRYAVDALLKVQPAGLAMAEMNKRYDLGNAILSSTYDRLKRGKLKETDELKSRLASTFIWRSDAQNYMILGDPAVRLRISEV